MATIILGDIVEVIKETVHNPQESGFQYFVGLEHYDSGEPLITRYATPDNLTSSVKHFAKGDILVARRNVYLKRASLVDFEGVTSGDSIVLRAKDKKYQQILPFILNSDDFWDYAEQNSDGTMSKRLSPADLLDYEFEELENIELLADKLWAAYRVKESYKKLLAATDDMLNAKFHEMFGTADMSRYSLNDVAEVYDGTHQTPNYVSQGIRFVSVEDVTNTATTVKYISKEAFEKYKHKPQKGDLLMTRIGSIGKCAVVSNNEPLAYYVSLALIKPNHDLVLSEYLKCYIESSEGQRELYQRSLLRAFPMKINLGEIGKIKIILPSLGNQQKFVEIATQAEATKESLRKSIENIDQVIKSLINQ